MAKTFLTFERKSISLGKIDTIEPFERWDDKEGTFIYTIEINRDTTGVIVAGKDSYVFKYFDEGIRDNKMEILRMLLEDVEWIEFIGE